jgi:hypothetical protein
MSIVLNVEPLNSQETDIMYNTIGMQFMSSAKEEQKDGRNSKAAAVCRHLAAARKSEHRA